MVNKSAIVQSCVEPILITVWLLISLPVWIDRLRLSIHIHVSSMFAFIRLFWSEFGVHFSDQMANEQIFWAQSNTSCLFYFCVMISAFRNRQQQPIWTFFECFDQHSVCNFLFSDQNSCWSQNPPDRTVTSETAGTTPRSPSGAYGLFRHML